MEKILAAYFVICTNLRSLPAGLFKDCVNATEFTVAFFETGLLFLPEELFKNCNNITSFELAFYNCKNLTEIPEDLFQSCKKVSTFAFTFWLCTNLTSIPSKLLDNCNEVIDFTEMFAECTALTGVTPNTNGMELWQRTKIPGDYLVITGTRCFYGCTNLNGYNDIPSNWK